MPFVIPESKLRQNAQADGITHLSTGIAVIRSGKLLVVRRAPDDFPGGMFELPGGGIDFGETIDESLRRELLEETGLKLIKIIGMFDGFDYSTPRKPRVRQFNVLVEADGEVILSLEHDKYLWIREESISGLTTTGPMNICMENALKKVKGY